MHVFVIQDPEAIDEQLIDEKLKDNDEVRVQFSKPVYNRSTLTQLDKLALNYSAKFKIRFYGHGNPDFDCTILNYIPNVKALSIDCFYKVKNIHALKELNFLEKVGIGILDLEDLDILSYDNLKKVNKLLITDTRSKKLNLEFLKDYDNLTDLLLAGNTKNINSLAYLTGLENLSLNSITKTSFEFLNNLQSLKTLRIILGGRENINEIDANNIENLEIVRVRGFNDASALKNFKSLKCLRIEDEIKLQELHFPKLDYLEDVKILNCKSLKSITGIEQLNSFRGFRISEPLIAFEDFIAMKFPMNLNTLAFYTWKTKQDKLIRRRLDAMSYLEFGN